jgi:hypothetical protein
MFLRTLQIQHSPHLEYGEIESLLKDRFPECRFQVRRVLYRMKYVHALVIKYTSFIHAWIIIAHHPEEGITGITLQEVNTASGVLTLGRVMRHFFRGDFHTSLFESLEKCLSRKYHVLH